MFPFRHHHSYPFFPGQMAQLILWYMVQLQVITYFTAAEQIAISAYLPYGHFQTKDIDPCIHIAYISIEIGLPADQAYRVLAYINARTAVVLTVPVIAQSCPGIKVLTLITEWDKILFPIFIPYATINIKLTLPDECSAAVICLHRCAQVIVQYTVLSYFCQFCNRRVTTVFVYPFSYVLNGFCMVIRQGT